MKNTPTFALIFAGLILTLSVSASAQIATGGVYQIDQAVIASGGGTSSAGSYSIDGTIGHLIYNFDGFNFLHLYLK